MTDAPASDLVTAQVAADLLGVKVATVYTYVSRGMLAPHRLPRQRGSRFSRADVEQLRVRTAKRTTRGPKEITTAVTVIADGSFWYRGVDPVALARRASYERVAEFLWTGELPESTDWRTLDGVTADALGLTKLMAMAVSPLDQLRVASAALAVIDDLRFGTAVDSVVVAARMLISTSVCLLPERSVTVDGSVSARLWSRLCSRPPSEADLRVLDTALVLLADHSVAPSTLAARVAASYRADPHGSVEAGLAILAGGWHGRRAISAESMLKDIVEGMPAATAVGRRYREGGVPALGQPRYPDGDPRFSALIDVLEAAGGHEQVLRAAHDVADLAQQRALPPPSVEFGLAAVSRAFDFVGGASEAIFAVARMAGWIAHAIEEYANPIPASPRFRYVGEAPGAG